MGALSSRRWCFELGPPPDPMRTNFLFLLYLGIAAQTIARQDKRTGTEDNTCWTPIHHITSPPGLYINGPTLSTLYNTAISLQRTCPNRCPQGFSLLIACVARQPRRGSQDELLGYSPATLSERKRTQLRQNTREKSVCLLPYTLYSGSQGDAPVGCLELFSQ
ncbi:unnamed protein product [Leuciscus chuanchicus]